MDLQLSPAPAPFIQEERADYEALTPGSSLATDLTAGAFAGTMEHTVMYPVDAIKVLKLSPAAMYDGITGAISKMSAREGIWSFWRGINSVLLGAGPAHAVHFATYEGVKIYLGVDSTLDHHPFAIAFSGACATMASDALMNPFDVIKQRMQVHGSTHRGVLDCARIVFRAEGLSSFFISYPATISMTIPFAAIQFAAYDSFSKILNPTERYDPVKDSLIGALAGGLGAAATTPLDVVKTLVQTRGTSKDLRIRNCTGMWQATRLVYTLEGFRGFARGIAPRIINMAPSTGICWHYFPPRSEEL